ncbi:MAG: hypothetical protein ACJ8CR_26870 [Roseiflexaceae bacterium]
MSSLSPDSQAEAVLLEPDARSAVRSHQSYDSRVHAICHHSGQYLTRDETYPKWINPLREQHDFPGVPALDGAFARAAHAQNHRHRSWSRPAIAGLALVLSNLLLLFLIARVFMQRDQVTTDVTEFVLFYTLVTVGAIVGLGLLIRGGWLLANRTAVYHRRAALRQEPPAVADFPLLGCTYEIIAHEHLQLDLGNDQPLSPEAVRQRLQGVLTVNLYPGDVSQEHYQAYMQCYASHIISGDLHLCAGTLALEQVHYVDFGDQLPKLIDSDGQTVLQTPAEFDHRIVLRAPVPPSLTEGSYTKENGPLTILAAPYTIRARPRYHAHNERQRFSLECMSRLNAYDSYTLELVFRWRSSADLRFFLDECRLHIPPELGTVDRVDRGRFDAQHREVIWRNLFFQSQSSDTSNADTTSSGRSSSLKKGAAWVSDEDQPDADELEQLLVLGIRFSTPLLEHQRILTGEYHCSFNGLLSGMSISSERIWSARGLKVAEDDEESIPIIQRLTTIEGDIIVDTRKLSQRHENIHPINILCPDAPNHKLVDKILRVLIRCDIDLQRIEQAIPRLDPAGSLRNRLYYWEIVGRLYNPSTLESVDVHIVISGYDQTTQEAIELPRTQIDLRVRCTHDPRNSTTPQYAMKLRGILVEELQREGVGSIPGYKVFNTAGCLYITLDQDNAGWSLSVENIGDQELQDITIELYPPESVDVNKNFLAIPRLPSAEAWKTDLVLNNSDSAWRLRPVGISSTSLFKKQQELDAKMSEARRRIFQLEQEHMMSLGGRDRLQLEQQIEQMKNTLRQYEQEQQQHELEPFTLAFSATYSPEGSNSRESFNGEFPELSGVRVSL